MFQNPFIKIKAWFVERLEEFGEGLFHSYTGSPVNEQIRVLRKARNRKASKKDGRNASSIFLERFVEGICRFKAGSTNGPAASGRESERAFYLNAVVSTGNKTHW